MNTLLNILMRERLTWFHHWGIGYYPVEEKDEPYRAGNPEALPYFNKYVDYARTELGQTLNLFRIKFVNYHYKGMLVDIGIGAGTFIEMRGNCRGFDVNPYAIEWLSERGIFHNPYLYRPKAITCWDSLEHIRDFAPLIDRTMEWVFISTPIYRDREHVLQSKHFRPNEHYWYFTEKGLTLIMCEFGYELAAVDRELGREDIGIFAFKRFRK